MTETIQTCNPLPRKPKIVVVKDDVHHIKRITPEFAKKILEETGKRRILIKEKIADSKIEYKETTDDKTDLKEYLYELSNKYLEMEVVPPILLRIAKQKRFLNFTDIQVLTERGIGLIY